MDITFNVPITFGRNGSGRHLNFVGVDFQGDELRSWTVASFVELPVSLRFARQPVEFQFEASPFVVPDVVPAQRVFLFLDGRFIGFCKLRGHAVRSFPLERNAISGRETRLTLALPDATSPQELNISADRRQLGIFLSRMLFRTLP